MSSTNFVPPENTVFGPQPLAPGPQEDPYHRLGSKHSVHYTHKTKLRNEKKDLEMGSIPVDEEKNKKMLEP